METTPEKKLLVCMEGVRTRAQSRALLLQQNVTDLCAEAAGTSQQMASNEENLTANNIPAVSPSSPAPSSPTCAAGTSSMSTVAMPPIPPPPPSTNISNQPAIAETVAVITNEFTVGPLVDLSISKNSDHKIMLPNTIPELKHLEDDTNSTDDYGVFKCAICLEQCWLKGKNPTANVCGHVFCGACVHVHQRMSLLSDSKCPLCMVAISSLLRIFP